MTLNLPSLSVIAQHPPTALVFSIGWNDNLTPGVGRPLSFTNPDAGTSFSGFGPPPPQPKAPMLRPHPSRIISEEEIEKFLVVVENEPVIESSCLLIRNADHLITNAKS